MEFLFSFDLFEKFPVLLHKETNMYSINITKALIQVSPTCQANDVDV